jgi:hypothetical protein
VRHPNSDRRRAALVLAPVIITLREAAGLRVVQSRSVRRERRRAGRRRERELHAQLALYQHELTVDQMSAGLSRRDLFTYWRCQLMCFSLHFEPCECLGVTEGDSHGWLGRAYELGLTWRRRDGFAVAQAPYG